MDVPCARIMSQSEAGPSGRVTEEVDSDDAEGVDSEETQIMATVEAARAEYVDKESQVECRA